MSFTKIYFHRALSPFLPAEITVKGSFDSNPVDARQGMLFDKTRDQSTSIQFNRSETSATDGFKVLSYMGISQRIAEQTLSGTVDILVQVSEDAADANLFWFVNIWVTVGDTNVVRGTLLSDYAEDTTNEWPTTKTGIAFQSAQTLTSVNAEEGDRIVAEIGYIARNTTTTSKTGGVFGGGPFGVADCTLGASGTAIGFLNFSNAIEVPGPPANDECSTAHAFGTISSVNYSQNTEWATENVSDPTLPTIGDKGWNTVWFTFTPASSGTFVIDGDGSNYDYVIGLYTGSCGSLTLVTDDDDSITQALTGGVQYTVLVASWDGFGGNLVLNIASAAPPPAPVLSVTTIQSGALTLSWPNVSPVSFYKLEQCAGSGCTGFTQIATVSPGPGPTTKSVGGLAPNSTYRFRVRAFHSVQGDGPYSNIVEVTTLPGAVGLSQVAFAVGGHSSFGRGMNLAAGVTRRNAHFALGNILIGVWSVEEESRPECGASDLLIKYRVQGIGEQSTTINGSGASKGTHLEEMAPGVFQERYCEFGVTLEMRGRFGSVDSLTNTHQADGYLEVSLNGEVVFRVDDIALGNQGTAGYSGQVSVNPGGTMTVDPTPGNPPPPEYILENGGMHWFYLNGVDIYGRGQSSAIFDFDFHSLTDADVFGPPRGTGPFNPIKNDGTTTPNWPQPAIWDGGSVLPAPGGLTTLQDSSPGGLDAAAMVSIPFAEPSSPPDVPLVREKTGNDLDCPCPCTCEEGPSSLGPVLQPEETEPLPEWVKRCGFGGLMPDGNDTTTPESWT